MTFIIASKAEKEPNNGLWEQRNSLAYSSADSSDS